MLRPVLADCRRSPLILQWPLTIITAPCNRAQTWLKGDNPPAANQSPLIWTIANPPWMASPGLQLQPVDVAVSWRDGCADGSPATRTPGALQKAQSPTTIAGLCRFATSLWLHFVASPQRVPGIGHRRRGSPVVNVIYRAPPRRD